MSIYKKQAIVETTPVFDYVKREEDNGYINVTDGEVLATKVEGKGFYEHHVIGSVVSYALRSNECPLEAVARAKENGHELYYTFKVGACLSAHQQPRETMIVVEDGTVIRFEGKIFTVKVLYKGRDIKLIPA